MFMLLQKTISVTFDISVFSKRNKIQFKEEMYYFWMLESFFSLLHFWLHDLINYGQKGGFLLPSGYEYDSTYTGLLQI